MKENKRISPQPEGLSINFKWKLIFILVHIGFVLSIATAQLPLWRAGLIALLGMLLYCFGDS